jgi:hypothetical protein
MSKPIGLFQPGKIGITPTAEAELARRGYPELARTALARHVMGDWGDVPPEDAALNDEALRSPGDGQKLMSVFYTADGLELWVITERECNETTVLLPEDY